MLIHISGFSPASMTALMMLAGFGMVVGNLTSGRLSDRYTPGKVGATVQGMICIILLLIFFLAPHPWCAALLMASCTACLFAVSSPEQVSIIRVAAGGEMFGAACVQVAFNLGNAIGAYCGGKVLHWGYQYPALIGVPLALVRVLSSLHDTIRNTNRNIIHKYAAGSTPPIFIHNIHAHLITRYFVLCLYQP